MKKLIPIVIAFAVLAFASCNGSSTTEDHSKMDHTDDMPMQPNADADKDVKIVVASYTNIDPAVAVHIKSLTDHYLAVKNALVDNNISGAAAASGKIVTALKGFDKSLLTAEQKKVYDDIADDMNEHADHIAKNELEHQRHHFSMMSEDMYALVKAFGAGMTLYHDHCPMYNDNKGGMWLSETRDIRNPYYGDKMMTCGSVEEMFK